MIETEPLIPNDGVRRFLRWRWLPLILAITLLAGCVTLAITMSSAFVPEAQPLGLMAHGACGRKMSWDVERSFCCLPHSGDAGF